MTSVCCDKPSKGKLYSDTDIAISFRFSDEVSIDIDDVVDCIITFERTFTKEKIKFSIHDGNVSFFTGVDNDEPKHFLVAIEKGDIPSPGKYFLSVRVAESDGSVKGLTPSPKYL